MNEVFGLAKIEETTSMAHSCLSQTMEEVTFGAGKDQILQTKVGASSQESLTLMSALEILVFK